MNIGNIGIGEKHDKNMTIYSKETAILTGLLKNKVLTN